MDWHYEKNGAPVGPVSEAQMDAARARGEVLATTRVWREGWPDWKPAGEVWPRGTLSSPPPVPAARALIARCAECGRTDGEMVSLAGSLVCPACKPLALAKLREGVPLGVSDGFAGPWRDGKYLVVTKLGPMPPCCIKCGNAPSKSLRRTLTWHHPALYLIIFVGILIYVIVAVIVRKTAKLLFPVCAECNARRVRNIAIGWLSFLLAIALFFGSAYLTTDDDVTTGVALAGGVVLLITVVWAVAVQFVLARKITDQFVWVRKISPKVLDTLPQFPGASV
jgi:hypothetical protein